MTEKEEIALRKIVEDTLVDGIVDSKLKREFILYLTNKRAILEFDEAMKAEVAIMTNN